MSNLIYFHVNGKDFVTMYDMCLDSVQDDIREQNFDVLCITNDEFKDQIQALHDKYKLPKSFVHVVEYKSDLWMHKYLGKFDILEWEHVRNYKTIIFSDVDILYMPIALKAMNMTIKEEDVLYVVPEQMEFTQPWFYHDKVYTPEETQKIKQSSKQRPLNGGLFGWKNSNTFRVIEQLKQVREHVYEKGATIETAAWEQPYLNHRFLVDQNLDYGFEAVATLQPEQIVNLMQKQQRFFPIALHFTYIDKIKRMTPVLEFIKQIKLFIANRKE